MKSCRIVANHDDTIEQVPLVGHGHDSQDTGCSDVGRAIRDSSVAPIAGGDGLRSQMIQEVTTGTSAMYQYLVCSYRRMVVRWMLVMTMMAVF